MPETVHKEASKPTAVQELYAWYRVARDLGEAPSYEDVLVIHEVRGLDGEGPGHHTYTSFGKAYELGDPTWTNLNEVDVRYRKHAR